MRCHVAASPNQWLSANQLAKAPSGPRSLGDAADLGCGGRDTLRWTPKFARDCDERINDLSDHSLGHRIAGQSVLDGRQRFPFSSAKEVVPEREEHCVVAV